MACDGKLMRQMLREDKQYTVDEIWDKIVHFEERKENADSHYFVVEMIGINEENTALLDEKAVREYLSFVAPVPYSNKFSHYASKIHEEAKRLSCPLDEYKIRVNGAEVFKDYGERLKERSGNNPVNYDDITDVAFHEYKDETGRLLAWSWIGLSRFEKMIPEVNKMRGLRLRSHNIQVGGDDVLKGFFKETRGNYYFVGEVFALSRDLIPNSQRDYFDENAARKAFETSLREYFYYDLHKLYYDANRIKNAYKDIESYPNKMKEYNAKAKEGNIVDDNEDARLKAEIDKAKEKADKGRKTIAKFDGIGDSTPIAIVNKNIKRVYGNSGANKDDALPALDEATEGKGKYVAQSFSSLTRAERKIIIKILAIITETAPEDTAKLIVQKIKDEFK